MGAYEILAPIGAGGMGEVYRATDTQLKRDVALKALLPAFAGDPERYVRFQREAELLASLNHPNIATLYGITEGALVMEFVEGESLPCPLPIETAVQYARQIAEALEYAHDRGVIHRDLKPDNIKVTPDGVVKLLDFGLAKALDNEPAPTTSNSANSPTLTLGHTIAGQILGTAAYMAPEQVEGRAADRRADIWSFGAVLFEMLSGKRAFEGSRNVDTLASVMKLDPDWSLLPPDTPAHVQTLIRRCLKKDRKQRLQAIGEARIALDNPVALASAQPHQPRPYHPGFGSSLGPPPLSLRYWQPPSLSSTSANNLPILPNPSASNCLLRTCPLATPFDSHCLRTEPSSPISLPAAPPGAPREAKVRHGCGSAPWTRWSRGRCPPPIYGRPYPSFGPSTAILGISGCRQVKED